MIRDCTTLDSPSIQRCLFSFLFSLTLVIDARAQSDVSTVVAGNRFEKNVQAYEAADRANPPPQKAILLAGDSQFFRWKTDRKSTRLNSSHQIISYAVFCLKKKQ